MSLRPRTRVIFMIATTAIVTVSMILSKCGIIPLAVFYTLLIAMHVWIFTRIGIKIYNLKQNRK